MNAGAAQAILMYFVLPVWLAAGFADFSATARRPSKARAAGKNPSSTFFSWEKWRCPPLPPFFLRSTPSSSWS